MKKIRNAFLSHCRKIGLLILNFLFNRERFFRFLGNRGVIKTVFVAYPASEEYADKYVYKRHRHWMRWKPWPAGIFKQNGKWGLMLVISSTEKDFKPENYHDLKLLVEGTENIRRWLNADQKTFAGVLPGVLYTLGLLEDPVERRVTVEALIKAEKSLRKRVGYSEDTPLILLGGKGFIGRCLEERLSREVYCVDVNSHPDKPNLKDWPYEIQDSKAILINLTRAGVVSHYTPFFWPGLVMLNEAYPAPEDAAEEIRQKGGEAFHLVGVEANSIPSFPKAYYGGIPCCAAWPAKKLKVILREL